VPSLLSIKARLKAVENIKKITRAMQLVAAAKFKRAEQRAKTSRPYTDELDGVLRVLSGTGGPDGEVSSIEVTFRAGGPAVEVPISRVFEQPGEEPPRRLGLVLVTSDRGMCGAFNTKLIRAALEFVKDHTGMDVRLIPLGRKGYLYFRNRHIPILFHEEKIGDGLELDEVRRITENLVLLFANGEVDALYMIYARFETATTSSVRTDKLLSIPAAEPEDAGDDYILEPDRRSAYRTMVPLYATTKIYAALADSFASEYGARMTAMQLATKNAEEMVGRLIIERNRLRQAVITKELSEIVGAVEALK
jgi:F-type H+-transporting ATPase subunit gamma